MFVLNISFDDILLLKWCVVMGCFVLFLYLNGLSAQHKRYLSLQKVKNHKNMTIK